MPQKAARKNRDLEARRSVAHDRLAQREVKGAFAVGAAARELLALESLDERIRHRLAGAVEHLALDPDRTAGFAAGRVGVVLEGQSETEERPDGLRRGGCPHASIGVARRPRSTMSQR